MSLNSLLQVSQSLHQPPLQGPWFAQWVYMVLLSASSGISPALEYDENQPWNITLESKNAGFRFAASKRFGLFHVSTRHCLLRKPAFFIGWMSTDHPMVPRFFRTTGSREYLQGGAGFDPGDDLRVIPGLAALHLGHADDQRVRKPSYDMTTQTHVVGCLDMTWTVF